MILFILMLPFSEKDIIIHSNEDNKKMDTLIIGMNSEVHSVPFSKFKSAFKSSMTDNKKENIADYC